MIATRALRNSRMINNGEGQGELSLKNRERERERIEALSREIWGRESGETGTRIINDLERQVFADNRLELLRLAFHILFFLSFEEFRIPRNRCRINQRDPYTLARKNILDELERDKQRKKRRP